MAKRVIDEKNELCKKLTEKDKVIVNQDANISKMMRQLEDIKKENIELKKKSGLLDVYERESSVTHKRNSELVTEKKINCKKN